MAKPSKQILGVVLICAGLALTVLGVKMLFGPNQYASTARIKIENNLNDISYRQEVSSSNLIYGKRSVRSVFEMTQSPLVLSNVVATYNLNWRQSRIHQNWRPLNKIECMAVIRDHLQIASIRDTNIVTLTYFSDDPDEAELLVNQIAQRYLELCYRLSEPSRYPSAVLKEDMFDFQSQERLISSVRDEIERLRKQIGQKKDAVNLQLPETSSLSNFLHDLATLKESHNLLKEKIEREEQFSFNPETFAVQIIAFGETPKSSIGPNRLLGAGLLILGFGLLVGGVRLLHSKDALCSRARFC